MTEPPSDTKPTSDPEKTPEEKSTSGVSSDTAAPPQSQAAKPSALPASIVATVAALVILIAIVATSPFWAHMLPWAPSDSDLADRVAALETRPQADSGSQQSEQRLRTLDQRVARLEEQAKNAPQAAAPDPALANRLATLEQRLLALDPQANQPLQNDIHQTADRVAKIEEQLRSQGAGDRRDQALLLAIGQLRSALSSSRPFASELATIATFGRDRPDLPQLLKPLEGNAAKGIPSITLLAQRFAPASDQILRAAAAPAGDSFGERALARVQSLVTIRRVGTPGKPAASGDPTEDAVNTAELALAGGDLSGAVAAIKGLTGPGAEAAKPWLAEAESRLNAESALAKVEAYATAQVVAGGKAAP